MTPTPDALFRALFSVISEKHRSCEQRLAALPASAITERRLINTERGMYSLVLRAGFVFPDERDTEKAIFCHKKRLPEILPADNPQRLVYDALSEEDKSRCATYLYCMTVLQTRFIDSYRGVLENARICGDTDAAFHAELKIRVLSSCMALLRDVWASFGAALPQFDI